MRRCAWRPWLLLACLLWPASAIAQDNAGGRDAIAQRDLQLIDARLQAMPASSAGTPVLYVVGFAGDGNENVFRNEVDYLGTLMAERYDAGARMLSLVNHPDSLGAAPRPLATLANLRHAFAGIGQAMDREKDLLLLYVTTHGTRDHLLSVALPGQFDTAIRPAQLRDALDDAGIRHRLLIVSACFSGGFVPALKGADTLVITAARRDRPSFGCGDTTSATYFGRALLVEGMNRDQGLVDAFEYAKRQVTRRETMSGFTPSEPQIHIGDGILAHLHAWEATLEPGRPVVPYPHALD